MLPRKVRSVFWHRIDSDSTPPEFLDHHNPTEAVFREQIGFLAGRFTPISIWEFLEIQDGKRSIRSYARPPVLLGFDDGFRSVVLNGLPILREFGAPAVFFVTAMVLQADGFVPWFVEVKQLLRRAPRRRVAYQGMIFDLASPGGRVALRRCVADRFRALCVEVDRECVLSDLAKVLNCPRPNAEDLDDDLRFVSRDDLFTLGASSLLAVASHGMTHRFLTKLSREEQDYELRQSDLVLRESCPSYCPVIAYPAGAFNADTLEIAQRVYAAGFAVWSGASYRTRYAYPRIGIEADGARELRRQVTG